MLKKARLIINTGVVAGFILLLIFASCTPQKQLVYLQNQKISNYDSTNTGCLPYKIRINDNLYVDITSTNKNNLDLTIAGAQNNINPFYVSYFVNDSGEVNLPLIGAVMVKGLTVEEARVKIQDAVKAYIISPSVRVRVINFKVTVLGEVNHPGTYYLNENNLNILEAIGQANDLTHYGNRHKVMIIRANEKGQRNSYYIDLTDKKLLFSEKFFLLNNDVVYVEPNRLAKTTQMAEFPWTVVFSVISSTVLILTLVTTRK